MLSLSWLKSGLRPRASTATVYSFTVADSPAKHRSQIYLSIFERFPLRANSGDASRTASSDFSSRKLAEFGRASFVDAVPTGTLYQRAHILSRASEKL